MSLEIRPSRTATGKAELVVGQPCGWEEFPGRARAVVDCFGMSVVEKVDGVGERLWIARLGEAQFCISWDDWFGELSIIAWEDTPDAELERLVAGAD
jgi:hypothetical protein